MHPRARAESSRAVTRARPAALAARGPYAEGLELGRAGRQYLEAPLFLALIQPAKGSLTSISRAPAAYRGGEGAGGRAAGARPGRVGGQGGPAGRMSAALLEAAQRAGDAVGPV